MSHVRRSPAHSLASLVIDPDDYIYLRQMKTVLDSPPNRGPPQMPTQLAKHLFIGTLKNADDISLLQTLGITHVINCAGTRNFDLTKSPYSNDSGITNFFMIPAEDHADYDIMHHFSDAFAFLDRCKKLGGKALVHCNLGINRSGAICAAYMMVDQHIPLLEVISVLKSKRSVVICNKGFRRQLVRFARAKGLLDIPQYVPSSCSLRFGTDRTNMLSLADYQTKFEQDTLSSCKESFGNDKEKLNGYSNYPMQNYSNRGTYVSVNHKSLERTFPKTNTSTKESHQNYANKRPIATSHYDNEYFMDTIPEDFNHIQNGRREHLLKESKPSAIEDDTVSSRSLSLFGSKSKISFTKSKARSASSGDSTKESLSTTRPLRVYKRSVTDTELYQKPTPVHTYKRADTVDTSDLAMGLERLSVADKSSSLPTGLSRQHRSSSRRSISSSIFSRFRPDTSK